MLGSFGVDPDELQQLQQVGREYWAGVADLWGFGPTQDVKVRDENRSLRVTIPNRIVEEAGYDPQELAGQRVTFGLDPYTGNPFIDLNGNIENGGGE